MSANINPAKYRKPDTRDHCHCDGFGKYDDRRSNLREREEFNVMTCRHGHVWLRVATDWRPRSNGPKQYWGMKWKRLSKWRNPIKYRRAIEAIATATPTKEQA